MTRVLALASAAAVAILTLAGRASAQCGFGGDCLAPHPGIGCSDLECCAVVCAVDPLCCSQSWDADCVNFANLLCVGLCGATASGDCSVPHPTPACSRRECCETVCADDPFCCETGWDTNCVAAAGSLCPSGEPVACGDPSAGSCSVPHSTPSCDDRRCCELVCALDPTCCENSWNFICVQLAGAYCVESCEPSCPAGATAESEDCGQDRNNPCYGTPSEFPEVQSLACGTWACGRIASTPGGFRDIDVWSVSVVDADGDGEVPVRLSLAASFDGFAALVPASCGPLAEAAVSVASDFCVEFASAVSCVPPGEYRLVVAPGAFPSPATPDLSCGSFGTTRYRVRLECLASGCGPACGPGAGSCFEASKQPGCEDPACCEAVCPGDPFCCEVQWDTSCVEAAQSLCAEPPENDECRGAVLVSSGSIEVSNIGATASFPPFPASCGGDSVGSDVWYRVVAPSTATGTVSTCGSVGFDTAIAVFASCGTEPIACSDNESGCIPKTASTVSFPATCGESYLIWIGSVGGDPGSIVMRIDWDAGPSCGCAGDLDGDGAVGGSDLTRLLSAWGGSDDDLDGDGIVGASDLTVILSAWGACP
jgi:hypothetical protein